MLLRQSSGKFSGLMAAVIALVLSAAVQASDVAAGRSLYESACLSCHGVEGNGQGPAAAEFVLRPRPFAQAAFKFDTDSDWIKGTDTDLANVIRNGAAQYGGSAMMVGWPSLSEPDIGNLVAYIRTLGPQRVPQAAAVGFDIGFAAVYQLLSDRCGECHVQGAADGPWSLDTPPGESRFPTCLALPEDEQLICASYHELLDPPADGIPGWVVPEETAASAPYVQACVPEGSFHIGYAIPEQPEADLCAALGSWIESGAGY